RWRAATVGAVAGFLIANYFLAGPTRGFVFNEFFVFELAGYALSAGFIIFFGEMMHRAREREVEQKNLLGVTLASIGDGVIATDSSGRVIFLNAEAQRLTGWRGDEASGRPLLEVFRIVNEWTQEPAEDPAERVLRTGKVVGLANHIVLFSKDGRRTPIDDSAAPIRLAGGSVSGVVLVFRDVTTQRKAQEASARLAAIVQSSGDAIFAKSPRGVIETWNAAAEQLFGYQAEEIIGKHATLLFPPERLGEEEHILELLRQGKPNQHLETVRVAKDGRHIPVLVSVSPLKDNGDNIIGASTIVRDVREIVAARDALIREKELLATTLASIGDGVIVTDAEGRITFVNSEAERLTGWKSAEAARCALPEVFRIINEQTRETVENPVEKVLRLGTVVGLANHTVLIRKDGREIPIDDSGAPIRLPNGLFFGVVLVFRDFTERKKAEMVLREREERFRTMANSAPVLIWTRDPDKACTWFNQRWLEFTGRTMEQELGKAWNENVHPEDFDRCMNTYSAQFDARKPFSIEYRLRRHDGAWRWILDSGVALYGPDGQLSGYVGSCIDITDQRDATAALEKAKREAEEANRAKDHFLAMLSHELRTPLTPVLMTATVLEADSTLPKKTRSQLAMMRRNIELEARLIDDLLDLTRIAHGKFEIRNEPVDVHAAIEHALGISASDLNAKRLTVTKRFEAADHFCRGDAARLHEVFWNVLRNAVKFTPEDGRIDIVTRNDDRHGVIIEFQDTGIGIEPEVLPRIFDVFEQGDPTTRARYGGLGLGLAISKRIINLHDGTISVHSPGRDRGSIFTVTLHALESSSLKRKSPARSLKIVKGRVRSKILVVEDHKDTADVLCRILESAGCAVSHCATVGDAKRAAEKQKFDLVICDIGLPDGNGLDLMRHLRETHGLTGIALSGFGAQEDLAASKAAGFAVHLIKPVDLDRLRQAIAELLENEVSIAPPVATA
ncbi:MAG TPA: PAS domain S-box protein, partial [Chthoniobacterales bacterium]|nr:PAS domain S-box protein [Chthoniobacterales bacterium]